MGNTVTVELNNSNALNLLYDLEKMSILKIVKNNVPEKINFSERFKGFLPKEQGEDLKRHVEEMRNEWDRGF